MPSFDTVYAWSKDWQYLIGGLLTVLAACIFAIGAIVAARIRAGGSRRTTPLPDLRSMAGAANDDPKHGNAAMVSTANSAPVFSAPDISRNLDHLRWLIRTGLSPQLSSDVSQASLINCCQRIGQMQLEEATFPDDAPEMAHAQRTLLLQDTNALRQLAETQAASSEIISALIKLNSVARDLASLLSENAGSQAGAISSSR